MQRFLFCLFVAFLCCGNAFAAALIADQQTQISRAERYLNARNSFTARFLQTTEDGAVTTGTLLVSRPGKMNLTYDPPLKDFIIADGSFVYLWDGDLQTSTTLPLGGSLADLILRAGLKLSGDITVLQVTHEKSRLEITVQQAKDPDQGSMTLVFEDNPLLLHGWRVTDAQNRVTSVTLQNIQENVPIPARSFTFVPPRLGKSGKSDRPINP
jgi:outer membrane lipoprotein-sorting protein